MLRALIARLGPCGLARERQPDPFAALVEAILYQQLAYRAAQAIERRFQQLYRGASRRGRAPRPPELLRTPAARLRAAGLSRAKIRYLRDLARHAAAGRLGLQRYARMSDEEIIADLVRVKGIGRWTAEMFLIFSLGRPDVLPVDDLGLQQAIREAYKLRRVPSASRMRALAEPWRPYRTVATWYLWKSRRVRTSPDAST